MDDVYGVEVEATADTVEEAREMAARKLGLSEEQMIFTVIQEGKKGFLGRVREPAIVTGRAKPRERTKKRRRRRRGSGGGRDKASTASSKPRTEQAPKESGDQGRDRTQKRSSKPTSAKAGRREEKVDNSAETPSIDEQAAVAKEFLEGLLGAFGLDGTVTHEVQDDVLIVKVDGDQTEALVGNRGAIMQSVLELTRTVIQRKTFGAPRMRLDIAGYGERRREALRIYAVQLAEKVLADGGEVMLEPMNPADRKVVHDSIADVEGVRSFSEGEDPHRSVVISAGDTN